MELKNKNTQLKLSENFGSLLSYQINGEEFCAKGGEKRPLFSLKLLDGSGNPLYFDAFSAQSMDFSKLENGYQFVYYKLGNTNINAVVEVKNHPENMDEILWHISVDNQTEHLLEWIDFPKITVPDTLIGEGGASQLFWPAMEGQIIENKSLRDELWIRYDEIGGQTGGYCGFYPGSCPMQFMAYYTDQNGLYFAAHDANHNLKTVEFYGDEDGIALEYRLFCGGAKGVFDMNYDMVTRGFSGDWHDAAELYRDWMETNTKLPKKLYENDRLPEWLETSPVVVLYPIRGTIDHGDMTPNLYYPYQNILPFVEEYADKTDSRIMALPMHWEGTAPWATPYVWPPFGGEAEFCDFVSQLHEQGHLAGVYCSGIGWTTKSFLDPTLDFSDRYDETLICRTPQNTIEQSRVIGEPIRLGYDMCPQSDKVADIVAGEVVSIAKSGCDYAQYFDQNLGGESCFCYARDHGHPPAPGVWQNDAMIRIFKKVQKELDDMGSPMLIGCEGAASEPFIEHLPFNDLRYNIGFFFAKPVPAYSYLFHEYLNNFMGNQNTIHDALDLDKNPDCVLFRIAYSFAAGDLLTVALGDHGDILWGWDVPWTVEIPEQEPIFKLIANLNRWRREKADYLHYGKMCKPKPIEGTTPFVLSLKRGGQTQYPSVLTSRWKNRDGQEGQVLVNYQNAAQTCKVECKSVFYNPKSAGEAYTGEIVIPPLSAVFVE